MMRERERERDVNVLKNCRKRKVTVIPFIKFHISYFNDQILNLTFCLSYCHISSSAFQSKKRNTLVMGIVELPDI